MSVVAELEPRALADLLVHVSPEGVVIRCDALSGRADGRFGPELTGHHLSELLHPADRARFDAALARCVAGGTVRLRHRLCDAAWGELDTMLRAAPSDGAGSEIIMLSRRSEAAGDDDAGEHAEIQARVSQRLQAIGQLATGLAHEINTPLQYVGDSVAFLGEALDELLVLTALYRDVLYCEAPISLAERRQKLQHAEAQADVDYLSARIPAAFSRTADGIDRVRSTVQALKRFSHSRIEIAPADLNDALRTTLLLCGSEYKYCATIDLDLAELPPVPCNVGELNQAFLNLIVNAAQAIAPTVVPNGPMGHIQVATRIEADQVVIEIADDGPGIPTEIADRIYEPFFTTKGVGVGTGQGLALVRATVDRHRGALECHSVVGVGTRFVIRLPLTRDEPIPGGVH